MALTFSGILDEPTDWPVVDDNLFWYNDLERPFSGTMVTIRHAARQRDVVLHTLEFFKCRVSYATLFTLLSSLPHSGIRKDAELVLALRCLKVSYLVHETIDGKTGQAYYTTWSA